MLPIKPPPWRLRIAQEWRAALGAFCGSGLLCMAVIYNYDRVDTIVNRLDRQQKKQCHVVQLRTTEDERLQDIEAYTSKVLADYVAPHSSLIQDTLRRQAQAQERRARVAQQLEKELGC